MKLYPIFKSLIDVFTEDGWEHWSRWSIDKRGFIKQVGGEPITGFPKTVIIKEIQGYLNA